MLFALPLLAKAELFKKENKMVSYQLKIGRKIEREHYPTYRKLEAYHKKIGKCMPKDKFAESIASDHIKEFPKGNYYSELAKMEKKLKK
jgi:hypothetical protein